MRSQMRIAALSAGLSGLLLIAPPPPEARPADEAADAKAAPAELTEPQADELFALRPDQWWGQPWQWRYNISDDDRTRYAAAARLYERLLKERPNVADAATWKAIRRLTACRVLNGEPVAAEAVARDAVRRFAGGIDEARARRLLAGIILDRPKDGWWPRDAAPPAESRLYGGEGPYTFHNYDRDRAVTELEAARDIYARLAANDPALAPERLECLLELAGAAMRFTPAETITPAWADRTYNNGWWPDGPPPPPPAAADKPADARALWPRNLPLEPGTKRVAVEPVPGQYSDKLPPATKARFVLEEVVRLDRTPKREFAAEAVYRKAVAARTLYGSDKLFRWASFNLSAYHRNFVDLLYGLADNQTLRLIDGAPATADLPPAADCMALWDQVARDYPDSGAAQEALFSRAVYLCTRRQFDRAAVEFRRLLRTYPGGFRNGAARNYLADIDRPFVEVQANPVRPAGLPATIMLSHRNVRRVEFVARAIPLEELVTGARSRTPGAENLESGSGRSFGNGAEVADLFDLRTTREVARWTAALPDAPGKRERITELTLPLTEAGAYLVTGHFGAGEPVVFPVLLADLAVLHDFAGGKLHLWCADARTGRPVAAKLDVEVASGRAFKTIELDTDDAGHGSVAEAELGVESIYEPKGDGANRNWKQRARYISILAKGPRGTTGALLWLTMPEHDVPAPPRLILPTVPAVGGLYLGLAAGWWARPEPAARPHTPIPFPPAEPFDAVRKDFLITDRPLYRPGDAVRVRLWSRVADGDRPGDPFRLPRRRTAELALKDPLENEVWRKTVDLDAAGGWSGDWTVPADAPLGEYRLLIDGSADGHGRQGEARNIFTVAEYRKPDFEVTVSAAPSQRPGGRIAATVTARRLFGGPVASGKVRWTALREDAAPAPAAPSPWDWLYGLGAGRPPRPGTALFDWNGDWGSMDDSELNRRTGEAVLGADGTATIELDTSALARAMPGRDHRFVITATVTDPQARTVEGRGEVALIRRDPAVWIEFDRNWGTVGEPLSAKVTAIFADGRRAAIRGRLTIRHESAGGDVTLSRTLRSEIVALGPDGALAVPVPTDRAGRITVGFASEAGAVADAVEESAWVVGDRSDFRPVPSAPLQVIPDRRFHQVGTPARVLVLTAQREAAVRLLSPAGTQVVRTRGGWAVAEVPVTNECVPAFTVSAVSILDGRVYSSVRRLPVPPRDALLQISVKPDKPEYRPGEKARIDVSVADAGGKPAAARLTLTAYDAGLLALAPENVGDIRTAFRDARVDVPPDADAARPLPAMFVDRPLEDVSRAPAAGEDPDMQWGLQGRRWIWGLVDLDMVLFPPQFTPDGWDVPAVRYGLRRLFPEVPWADPQPRSGRGGVPAGGGAGPPSFAYAGAPERGAAAPVRPPPPRRRFADSAGWFPSIEVGPSGKASVELTLPENLTTWRVAAWGITDRAAVGADAAGALATKRLLVRLLAPRLLRAGDSAVLSAVVHNHLAAARKVRVELASDPRLIALAGPATVEIDVPAGGERAVNWPVRAVADGPARLTVSAFAADESDAVEHVLPVHIRGELQSASWTEVLVAGRPRGEWEFTVPADAAPGSARLDVRLHNGPAGAMLDALPYLIGYPYGCAEQTMSRFLPTVLIAGALKRMGTDLDAVVKAGADRRKARSARFPRRWWEPSDDPPTDADIRPMVAAGFARLELLRNPDGGWGWWGGGTGSDLYMTAYVVSGLITAEGEGFTAPKSLLDGGREALRGLAASALKAAGKRPLPADLIFAGCVLSMSPDKAGASDVPLSPEAAAAWPAQLRALAALALQRRGDEAAARRMLAALRRDRRADAKADTVTFAPAGGWDGGRWGNPIETDAAALRAIRTLDPESPDAAGLVRRLLSARPNGSYWYGTRDTAAAIHALADAAGDGRRDAGEQRVSILLDGREIGAAVIPAGKKPALDNRVTIGAESLAPGRHTLAVVGRGGGELHIGAGLSFVSAQGEDRPAGDKLRVERRLFRMVGSGPDAVRHELKAGDPVAAGATVESELTITAAEGVEFVCIEDFRPAGCEPADLFGAANACSYSEIRDDRTAFFLSYLPAGRTVLHHRVRAETPGTFRAPPARAFSMYAPDIAGRSAGLSLTVVAK